MDFADVISKGSQEEIILGVGWVLIQWQVSLWEEKKSQRDTQRMWYDEEGRKWSDAYISQETSEIASKQPQAKGEAMEWILPQSLQKDLILLTSSFLTSGLLNYERKNSGRFQLPSLCCFIMATWQK